ncbi:hypothetical protein FMUND_5553 [Fusarium mundagurra]|uniref:CBM-cenC domain-containing protein n=1 Tax=Fusarium mundagurra TaxID=1567541 RepID=A0A8H6DJZ1_9HYPO|nr:hypothetical protein FMUND_5553 [Fusarium mundagurra]
MVRFTLLNVVVITAFLAGAEAGHCRPSTTAVTSAPATTTTAVPGCVGTQLLVNPGFDDNVSGYAPWTGNALIVHQEPQSGTTALTMFYNTGQSNGREYIKQTLTNLNGGYEFSYYYRVVVARTGMATTCVLQVSIGGDMTIPINIDLVVGDWTPGSVSWYTAGETIAQADVELAIACRGDWDTIQINLDSFAFTSVCSA